MQMADRAIWLRRVGIHAVVYVEFDGQWVEVIREPVDCPFSHIVEPSGISRRIKEHCKRVDIANAEIES